MTVQNIHKRFTLLFVRRSDTLSRALATLCVLLLVSSNAVSAQTKKSLSNTAKKNVLPTQKTTKTKVPSPTQKKNLAKATKPIPSATVAKKIAQPSKQPNKTLSTSSHSSTTRKLTNKPSMRTAASSAPIVKEVATRQKELLSLYSDIKQNREKIRRLENSEISTAQSLTKVQHHSAKVQRFVDLLEDEIQSLQKQAGSKEEASDDVAALLWRLRKRYSTLVQSILQKGSPSVHEMMLAADAQQHTADDAIVEAGMRHLTSTASNHAQRMSSQRDSLTHKARSLMTKSDLQNALLQLKSTEQTALDESIEKKKKILENIRSNKTQLLEQVKKNQLSAKKLSEIIRLQSLKATKKVHTSNSGIPAKKSISFNSTTTPRAGVFQPKTLPYPVQSRKIFHGYGTYKNSQTGTSVSNPGVDIAVANGSRVSTIAAGTVSLVSWLPGYGSLVIIEHLHGFRTVYANLSSVSVRKNQSITSGQTIGKSGESVDGEFVHIELWHERRRLNPLIYFQ